MAKAKGTKEAPVEEFSVDVEQSDAIPEVKPGADPTKNPGNAAGYTYGAVWQEADGTYKAKPDWADPDD